MSKQKEKVEICQGNSSFSSQKNVPSQSIKKETFLYNFSIHSHFSRLFKEFSFWCAFISSKRMKENNGKSFLRVTKRGKFFKKLKLFFCAFCLYHLLRFSWELIKVFSIFGIKGSKLIKIDCRKKVELTNPWCPLNNNRMPNKTRIIDQFLVKYWIAFNSLFIYSWLMAPKCLALKPFFFFKRF